MQLSPDGLKLIEDSEGLRLKAYQDTGGIWTIGYGHTNGVRPNQVITKEVAEQLLEIDIKSAQDTVNKCCLPCTQGQMDALVDFVFNIGPSKFLTSHLFSYHKNGEYEKAAAEFPKWKYDNGKVQPGLVTRRAREQSLYTRQEPSEDHLHTDEQVHSVPFSVDPVQPGQSTASPQSSPAPPAPASDTAPASDNIPSGFLSQVSESFRRLIAGLGE